jgi:hypothetical protein
VRFREFIAASFVNHTKHINGTKCRVFLLKTAYVIDRFLGMGGMRILKGISESGILILPA